MEVLLKFIFFGLFLFILTFVFKFATQSFIKAYPSKNYYEEIKNADVAVAFAFGNDEYSNGNLCAGSSNDTIMNWIGAKTNVKYIIAQKGCEISSFIKTGTHIIEMHPHDKQNYINTN